MSYSSWSVVFGEQPSASKWNILGTNDAFFYTYTGEGTNAIQQMVYNTDSAVATGTTTIPSDDTIPQNTEGTQFMTQAITPLATTNILVIECDVQISGTTSGLDIIGALFQDSTANALAAKQVWTDVGGRMVGMTLRYVMVAGTTSSTTFKLRIGGSSASTITFNGSGGARKFGAIAKSTMRIIEHKAS